MRVRGMTLGAGWIRHRQVVVGALGITQILAWGSSYYLPAVLAQPIASDTGWPLSFVIGGLSLGLLVSALVSPRVGRAIDTFGGRRVLAGASCLLAIGLAILAWAPSMSLYFVGWAIMGAGMGAGLYDAAFSTLGRLYGTEARPAISALTLWGGFASTVCWPLSSWLLETVGWRGACLAYAGLHVAMALPLHAFAIPSPPHRLSDAPPSHVALRPVEGRPRLQLILLGSILVLTAMITSIVSVHLLTLLRARGLDTAAAVSLGALIGPSQVCSRIVEMRAGRSLHPIWTMQAATALIAAGLVYLAAGLAGLAVALILYGLGNGIYSIARGTLPLALFGPEGYGALMGRLARPALLAAATAPSLGAFLLELGGPTALVASLTVAALVNGGLVAFLRAASGGHGRGTEATSRADHAKG